MSVGQFKPPLSDEPLDLEEALAAIPKQASISGMFLARMAQEASDVGSPLPSARSSYVPFEKYPLREHAQLIVEALPIFHPGQATREGLRRLGRGGPKAFLDSTLGKVTLGSVATVQAAIQAMAKAYCINMDPGHGEILDMTDNQAIVRMTDIHYFLDSHHVGSYEGVLWGAGVRTGRVLIRSYSMSDADLLLTW